MKKFKKVYIEITNHCNLACSFCSKVEKPRKMMTVEEFNYILKQVSAITNNIYLHVKGEPLLHPHIIEFLKAAEKYNLRVNLTTNGTIFPEISTKLAKCMSLHKINFSLHSENNKHNYLEDIFNNVKKLSPKTVIVYRLWTLQDGKFDEQSSKIVEKIKEHYKLSSETVEKLNTESNIKISSTIYVDKDNEFEWPDDKKGESKEGYCMALKTQLAILVDGTVVPCCLDSNGKIALGNIFAEPLEQIIESDKFKELKKSFQDRKPKEKLCLNCTYKDRFNYK